jgi:hypothetical protein
MTYPREMPDQAARDHTPPRVRLDDTSGPRGGLVFLAVVWAWASAERAVRRCRRAR